MNILVVGAHFYNKGAHLMMATVCDYFKNNEDVRLFLSPCAGTAEQIRDVGFERIDFPLKHVTAYRSFDVFFHFGRLIRLYKPEYRGVLPLSKIDAVLDISGFAYSDQWGKQAVINVNKLLRYFNRRKTKYVFLSQAFGPFSGKKIQREMVNTIDGADLIIARDSESEQMLKELKDSPKIRRFPDITIGLQPEKIEISETSYSCIVPNERMLDQGREFWPEGKYFDYLIRAIGAMLLHTEDKIYIVIHDNGKGDVDLGYELKTNFLDEERVEVFFEADPITLKGYLGQARTLVGSRFHALVSALSQDVPCLSLGWSHKYNMLFEEYGIPDLTFAKPEDERFETILNLFWSAGHLEEKTKIIANKNVLMKDANARMWDEVEQILFQ